VNWSRTSDQPPAASPSCWGWARAAGTGIRVSGSLAYVFPRLGQETGEPLWTAKAQALVQGIQAAQDPVMGGIPTHFHRTTDDTVTGGMSHHYDNGGDVPHGGRRATRQQVKAPETNHKTFPGQALGGRGPVESRG